LDLLGETLVKYDFGPSQIYNADKRGVPTVPTKLTKVLAPKGLKKGGE